ncbi:nucleoside triphosphate pyrophosphohydrolase [Lederbergia citri]|uniref:Nucleoside triphosphate pyrophosphohydrolase n=1 Tax=Lederbergia citri TaxID=2833580 RepID=A0A942TJA8_9BACI|nr:nucleoside triphosphate pyrophosphohydrolase [Lederbergia citri]MBS4197092.1 nucleoside triphosphate pyrophosphohydrolase [Lederbergia citri]
MPIYNKLVRDRIPEIIEERGKALKSRILDEHEFHNEIRKKLHEELKEYESANTNKYALEELADLLELIHAAASIHGADFSEIESLRQIKAEKRGSFNKRVFLIEVDD